MYPDSTLTLISLNGTFSSKRVAVPESQQILVGRLTDPNDVNYIPKFNSKVVSRNHAAFVQQGGKVRTCRVGASRAPILPLRTCRSPIGAAPQFFIKDVGSASGTFLQNPRFGDKPYRLSEQVRRRIG